MADAAASLLGLDVVVSLALAVLAIAGGRAIARGRGLDRPPPIGMVWLPAVTVGLIVDELPIGRYLGEPIRDFVAASVTAPTLALAVLAGGVVVATRPERGDASLVGVLPLVSISGAGILLCIPETNGLRLLLGPVLLGTAAVAVGWVRAASRLDVLAIGAAFAWMILVDGQERLAGLVGGSACLAAIGVSLAVARSVRHRSTTPDTRLFGWQLVVHTAVVAVCSRVGGVDESTAYALVVSAVALSVGAVAGGLGTWALTRRVAGPQG